MSESTKIVPIIINPHHLLQMQLRTSNQTLTHRFRQPPSTSHHHSISNSQRLQQQLIDISGKSHMIKSLKRGYTIAYVASTSNTSVNDPKCYTKSNSKESIMVEIDNLPMLSRCDSLDMNSDSLNRSRVPRVPKPPPRPLTSSSSSSPEQQRPVPQPPPPPPVAKVAPPPPPPQPPSKTAKPAASPPPPPPPKSVKPFSAKVRRVLEVVEFYHSLIWRESHRESSNRSSSADAPLMWLS